MIVADEVHNGGNQQEQGRRHSIVVMPTAIPNPLEVGGVEAELKNSTGNHPRNAGIVARKATMRVNVGTSAPIRRKPDLDADKPKKETDNDHTTPKDPKISER